MIQAIQVLRFHLLELEKVNILNSICCGLFHCTTRTHILYYFFLLKVQCCKMFFFFFKYTLRYGEKFHFRKTKYLLSHSPNSLHVTIDTISCSLFCSYCYRSADIVSTAYYLPPRPRPPPTPLLQAHGMLFIFFVVRLVAAVSGE